MTEIRPRARLAWLVLAIAVGLAGCDGIGIESSGIEDGINAYKKRDHARAHEILLPHAESGNPEAQYWIGVMHALGRGAAKDEARALRWYRLAADQAHVSALYELAHHYEHNVGDRKAAVTWYRKAAAQGDHLSLYRIARMTHRGDGARRDPARAVALYRQAAAGGNIYAQYILGRIYEEGIDVPRDPAEAARWYRQGAEQGEPQSALRLAMLYEDGLGVRQDDRKAVRWYRMAGRYSNVGPLPGERLTALYRSGRATLRDTHFGNRRWYLPPY